MRIFLLFLLSLVYTVPAFLIPQHAHAATAGFQPLVSIPGIDAGHNSINTSTLAAFFQSLYKYCVGAASILAVLLIVVGGIEIATQQGNAGRNSAGRKRITDALFGLLLVLSPFIVFSIINPSILNLSVGLSQIGQTVPQNTGNTVSQTSTTVNPNNAANTGSTVAALEQQCSQNGGAPSIASNSTTAHPRVICTYGVNFPAGATITQTQCQNLKPRAGTITAPGNSSVSCSSPAAKAIVGSGNATCYNLKTGGVCIVN